MGNIHYPVFNPKTMKKDVVMAGFFRKLALKMRAYSPKTKLSVDLFGEVAVSGGEKGIGQDLLAAAKYFDALCPMAYPSHYHCGEFGFKDPTAHPYEVYKRTVAPAVEHLRSRGLSAEIRPWIQAFTLTSIYGCGKLVKYSPEMIQDEIRGAADAGADSFMLWNAGSYYDPEDFAASTIAGSKTEKAENGAEKARK